MGTPTSAASAISRVDTSPSGAWAGTGEANEVVADITEVGGRAIAAQGDVADQADVAAMFDAAETAFGGVDVVIHTAGIMRLSPLVDTDLDTFDAIQNVNLRGTRLVLQQAARRLLHEGSIVALSTSVIGLALPTYAAYPASKGAVEAMIPILTKELRGRDINVNAVAPGPTATALFPGSWGTGSTVPSPSGS